MNESEKSYEHVDLWKAWHKPSEDEARALELRIREEQEKFEAKQATLPPKDGAGIEMMKRHHEMVVDEELDILTLDEDITHEDRKKASEVFHAAKYRGDVGPFFQYLEGLRNAPEDEREKAQKLLRVFEVAEHYFMHYFPLEQPKQKKSLEVIEDVQFDEKEFMTLFAEEDPRGIGLEGEDAFFEEYGPYPSEAFFSSKYYTQAGIIATFAYLGELDERITKELSTLPKMDESRDEYLRMFGSRTVDRDEDQKWSDYTSPEAEFEHNDFETKQTWDRFYAQRAFLFKCLGRVGDRSAIDFCLNYFDNYEGNTFRNDIVDVCSNVDPGYAAGRILGVLQSDASMSRYRRHDYTRMLYRMELGRIGISEEGMEYLGKRFDLGGYNSPENFVRRLTPSGDIGVYDNDKVLQGAFNVGDLTKNNEVVHAEVLAITKEMLFTPRADETPEDRAVREHILQEFKEKHCTFYDAEFLEKTGVHVNNLSLKEQGWFLHFMRQAGHEKQERAYAFVKTHGENGFRTFLAAEYGDEVGDKILELGEAVEKEDAPRVREIFRLYGATLDNAEALRTKLHNVCERGEGEQLQRVIDQTYEALVRRSKDLLLAAHEIAVRKQSGTKLALEHVQAALGGVNVLLEVLNELDGNGRYKVELVNTVREREYSVLKYHISVPHEEGGAKIPREEYYLKILARPEQTLRADGSVQAEARVNIELDFDTPYPKDLLEQRSRSVNVLHPNEPLRSAFYTNTEFTEQKKCVERHTLRLGIDRDTHYEGGRVSLDLGRGDHESEKLKRTGDVVGRLLQLVSEEGSHNTASFDREPADPETFRQLVNLLVERLTHASQVSPIYT